MAEPVRKTVSSTTVSPLHEETAESPRPHAVPQPAPTGKRSKEQTRGADTARRLRRRDRVRWTLFALLPLVLLAGGYFYVTGGQIMSTDDAYVQADRVGISTDVSGIVQDVAVKDNEHVEAGQVLYRLDPRQFQIALDNAKANLAQTAMSIDAMKQDYQRMLSDVAAQQAQVDLDQKNYDRNAMLLKTATVSQGYSIRRATRSTPTRASSPLTSNRSKCSLPSLAAIQTPRPTSIRNIARPRRSSTKRNGSSITPWSKRHLPAPSPVCRRSRPANISPPRPRPSFWSTPIMCGSMRRRRKPS
jgi:hypothetical protein